MYRLLYQSLMLNSVFAGFSVQTRIISLNSINKLMIVMVKCGVLFEIRAEF
jgi:hypothetical protein